MSTELVKLAADLESLQEMVRQSGNSHEETAALEQLHRKLTQNLDTIISALQASGEMRTGGDVVLGTITELDFDDDEGTLVTFRVPAETRWHVGQYAISAASAIQAQGQTDMVRVPNDVARLVVAARVVAYQSQGPEALAALDKAAEAFASRVPWDDEPTEEEQGPQSEEMVLTVGEATDEMRRAGMEEWDRRMKSGSISWFAMMGHLYRAMIAAAPTAVQREAE